jgi:hypothetical protein
MAQDVGVFMRAMGNATLSTRSILGLARWTGGCARTLAIGVMLSLLFGRIMPSAEGTEAGSTQAGAARASVAAVEVSAVTVEPSEIHLTKNGDQVMAEVTVQFTYQKLTSEQHVDLDVGTYNSDPPRVTAMYEPAHQTVRLHPGPPGSVFRKVSVKIRGIGANDKATLAIFGTLMNPSPGLEVVEDTSKPWPHAMLTIHNR